MCINKKVPIMVTGVQNYSINCRNYAKPSFCAVHPTRIFLKNSEGVFEEVVSKNEAEKFLRRIVKMLNKDYNDKLKKVQGHCFAPPSKEKPEEMDIRKRLVRFFSNRDSDYVKLPIARGFCTTNSLRQAEPYLLTGETVQMAKEGTNPIRKAWQNANDRAELVSNNLGITYDKAVVQLLPETSEDLRIAKRSYFDYMYSMINRILGKNDLKNSRFDAYFVPVQKGKSVTYVLVDAKLNGR